MEGTNEESSIRIEDLTVYPYCIRLKKEPKAKMKLRDNNKTLCTNGEDNRDIVGIGTKFSH